MSNPTNRCFLIFWLLLAGVVFFGLTLYARHVPEEWTLPIKGLSGLIAGLFALFGLKLELKDHPIFSALRFKPANVSLVLAATLMAIVFLLTTEHFQPLRVYCLPGTEIWVDGKYVRKVVPKENLNEDLESGPVVHEYEAIHLKWGMHEIVLKNNPLCPGREETFRRDIRFSDALLPFRSRKNVPSVHKRWVQSKMQPYPLFRNSLVGKDEGFWIAQVVTVTLGDFWEMCVEGTNNGKGRKPVCKVDRLAKPLLTIDSKTEGQHKLLVASTLWEDQGDASPIYRFIEIPSRVETMIDRNNVNKLVLGIWNSLERHIGDDELTAWIKKREKRFLLRIENDIQNEYKTLADAIQLALEERSKELVKNATTPTSANGNKTAPTERPMGDPLFSKLSIESAPDFLNARDAPTKFWLHSPRTEHENEKFSDHWNQETWRLTAGVGSGAFPDLPSVKVETFRVSYHLAVETQREKLEKIANQLAAETDPKKNAHYHWKRELLRVSPVAVHKPQRLEVRYYDDNSEGAAEALLKALEGKGLRKNSGRISRVLASDYERNATFNLEKLLEVWTAVGSF